MNLITFTWRTAKALFFVPAVFTFGACSQFMNGEPMAGWVCLLVGIILCLAAALGTAAHRERLRLRLLSQYVVQIIHNVNTNPHKAPEEQAAKDQCVAFIDDPLAWGNTFLKP